MEQQAELLGSSCMIVALRFSVACSWSSVSRLASLLSFFDMVVAVGAL